VAERYFPPVLDNSIVTSYKRCPTLFKLQYLESWASKFPSPHLHAGGAFAHALEETRRMFYVQGWDAPASIAYGCTAMENFWGDYRPPDYVAKTLDRMLAAFDFYWANYPLSHEECPPTRLPSGKYAIEFSFAQPLPIPHPISGDPLIYCGRMDMIADAYGGRFIVDEKTTSSLGPTWSKQWDLRSQFTGYAWGARENGLTVQGTIVRGVAILKTKFDTQQAVVYSPEWQIERWYSELLTYIQRMIADFERDNFLHNLGDTCADFGGCQFREACAVQDPTSQLETGFARRRWNPITRQTTEIL